MQRSPSWTWTINNLVRVLHTNASASKPTDDRYSQSARRVPHTDDATQRHRQQPGTHTHTHTQTHGRLVKLSLVSAGRVSANHAAQCQRQHDACHLHTSTVYLLTYLLTNITRTQIYAQCDSDVSLFHIYASWFLPPSCRYNSEKCLSLW